MDMSSDLQRFGIMSIGEIDAILIENVRKHLEQPVCKRRLTRQTELKWNADCEAVFTYFVRVSQHNMLTVLILI